MGVLNYDTMTPAQQQTMNSRYGDLGSLGGGGQYQVGSVLGGGIGAAGGSNSQNSGSSFPNPDLMKRYDSQYADALKFQNTNYANIMGQYAQLAPQILQSGQQAQQQYGALGSQVQGMIQGTDAARRQDIQDQYAQMSGAAGQSMASRGLGNTTVADSVQRGVQADRQKAETNLSNQMAQLQAGYASQLGGAGIQAQQQAMQQYAGLGSNYLGVLGGQHMPFPSWAPNSSTNFGRSQQRNAQQGYGSYGGGGGGGYRSGGGGGGYASPGGGRSGGGGGGAGGGGGGMGGIPAMPSIAYGHGEGLDLTRGKEQNMGAGVYAGSGGADILSQMNAIWANGKAATAGGGGQPAADPFAGYEGGGGGTF